MQKNSVVEWGYDCVVLLKTINGNNCKEILDVEGSRIAGDGIS